MRIITSMYMKPYRRSEAAQFICDKCGETKEVEIK